MAKPVYSDEEFIKLFRELGGHGLSKHSGIAPQMIYRRKKTIEKNHGILVLSPNQQINERLYPSRIPLTCQDGIIIVGSDAHVWPDMRTTAQRALIKFCENPLVKIVLLNGDIFDGASNSRHPRNGWSKRPTVREEMEAVDEFVDEVYQANRKASHVWLMGNHDMRFENHLANNAPQYEGVRGSTFKEHFPAWTFGISAWVNDLVVIKHRFKGGVHATHNNTVTAGKTMVTGHLHSLKVTPYTDYNGIRFGVDTGTLDDLYSPQQEYGEDNPVNHRSGFIVLTFHKGMLLWPEIVAVVDKDHVQFRGQVIKV